MAQKQGQNQGDVIRSFTLGNKELEGKTVEFQYDRGQYSITDVVGEERSIVYKSRNAQEAYTKWNVYIGRKKERPERPERQDRNGEERSAEDKQGRARDEKRTERENNRGERDNSRQERANNRSDRDTNRQERGNNNNRSERDNNRGRNRSNYRNNEPRAERNEDRNTDRAAGNGGYNQGFTAAPAESGAGEKRYRRPRRRRNDHREQES